MIAKDIHYIGVNDHRIDLLKVSIRCRMVCPIIPMLSQTERLP